MTGTIITFYSYKGGVGRSMALANIAVLLARRGLKVLVVDWDLEAPGLERYFSYFDSNIGGPGLLRMLLDAQAGIRDFRDFTTKVLVGASQPLTLLSSGREQDENYAANLESLDWGEFFAAGGGTFIESLREQWRAQFDIVLIDSRTGLSDAGGVCTIQLPDIVVAMFTANYQSLYGVRDVMRLAQQARQRLAYDRMPLSVLPLASRWGTAEFSETRVWIERVVEAMQEFFDDWLPRPLAPRQVLESIKVPHHSYFSFGERLAVEEQGTADPTGLGFVYDRVAAFLASGFEDVAALVGETAVKEAAVAAATAAPAAPSRPEISGDPAYEYDVFISYDHSALEWTIEFVEDLRKALESRGGRQIRIFFDVQEVHPGDHFAERIRIALERSRLLLAIVTPRYSAVDLRLLNRLRATDRRRFRTDVVAVLLRGEARFAGPNIMQVDFRKFALHRAARAPQESEWWRAIDSVARLVLDRLDIAGA